MDKDNTSFEDFAGGGNDEGPVYAAKLMSGGFHQRALSDTSSDETEEGQNIQKFQHFKVLIQQMQKELHSERIKNQGQATIANSVKEQKAENVALRKHLQHKDTAIAILQNRLVQVGQCSDVSLQEGEIVIPGPSRQILDSLTEENCKLKQNLRYMSVDPSHVEQLQKSKQNLERELADITKQVQQLKQENNQLIKILQSSENVKDNEILSLKQKINELLQSKDTQNVLCQSLTDETENLREKLRDMAEQCNKLERNLSTRPGTRHTSMVSGQKLVIDPLQRMAQGPESAIYKQEIDQMKAQLSHKDKELQEVVNMNARWQKYNDQREDYVQKLHKSLTETEDQLAKSRSQQNTEGISEEQQAEIDRIILQCKRKVEIVEEEKQKIEEENRSVLLQVHNFKEQLKNNDKEIATLKEHVQVLSNQQPSPQAIESDRERVQILEHQIKICTDDFKQERNDREKAMSRNAQLENELEFYRRQLGQFQDTRMDDLAQRRAQALQTYQNTYAQHHPTGQHNTGSMVARGQPVFQTDCSGDEGEDEIDGRVLNKSIANQKARSEDVIDGRKSLANIARSENGILAPSPRQQRTNASIISKPQTVPENMFSQSHNFDIVEDGEDSLPEQSDTIQCPKCHLGFSSDKHFDLLDHINDCC